MGKKIPQDEKQLRIAKLVRLISNGAVTSDLLDFMRREYGVSRSQAHRYIKEAREVIIEDINQNRQQVVAEMLHVAHTIVKNAMREGQYNNALGALNYIARIGGLEVNSGR